MPFVIEYAWVLWKVKLSFPSGEGDNSASTPTSQALPIRIRLRVNHADTTDSNKQNSDINPSTLSAKRQKRAHAMAEPSAANSIRYTC